MAVLMSILLRARMLHFSPPFEAVDEDGIRHVSGWTTGGSAKVHRQFIRLTPKRPKAQGWAWSPQRINSTQLALVLKVRFAGLADPGVESFATWLTSLQSYSPGTLFGIAETFVGLGVVTTSQQDRNLQNISVVVNSGRGLLTAPQSCQVSIRAIDREGYSSAHWAAIKVAVFPSHILVEVDPWSRGVFQPCVSMPLRGDFAFPAGWLPNMHLGFTAVNSVTGGTTHDITSLSFKDLDSTSGAIWHHETLTPEQTLINNWEHNFAGITDEVQHTLDALAQEEVETERRIQMLESRLVALLDADWEWRVNSLEALHIAETAERNARLLHRIAVAENNTWHQLEGTLETLETEVERLMADKLQGRVAAAELRFNTITDQRVTALEEALVIFIHLQTAHATKRLTTAWVIPFVLMLVILGGMMGNLWCSLRWAAMRLMQRLDRHV
jgi:hypothetical protein